MWKKSGCSPLKYFTTADILLFIIIFISSLFSLLLARDLSNNGERCIIETKKGDHYSLSLSKDTVFYVGGSLGKTEVIIEEGKAFIAYSPCPNKICMKMGKIKRAGEVVVCVPNGVILRIAGKEGIDGVTR